MYLFYIYNIYSNTYNIFYIVYYIIQIFKVKKPHLLLDFSQQPVFASCCSPVSIDDGNVTHRRHHHCLQFCPELICNEATAEF